jgi:CarD family transcriptional regulator
MYKEGDTILYGGHGVCRISGTQDKEFGHETRSYYVLNPVLENETTIFVPVGNEEGEARMRRILSAREVQDLIKEMPCEPVIWIEDEMKRKEAYRQILSGADRSALMQLIKTLYLRQLELKSSGKKLQTVEDRFLKDAEKILYEEFAYVLDIGHEEVLTSILEQIEPSQAIGME